MIIQRTRRDSLCLLGEGNKEGGKEEGLDDILKIINEIHICIPRKQYLDYSWKYILYTYSVHTYISIIIKMCLKAKSK